MKLLDQHAEQFEKLWEVFAAWNSKINLSAIREKEAVFEKHFEDSLLLTEFFDINDKKVLDIGAGGGFPTLPLAIATTAQITGLDSVGKKMKAVQAMADTLELKNVKTVHGRFEVFGQDKDHREQYDIVVARAVAPWNVLLEYALPFVKVGGSFIAYQGPEVGEALQMSRRGLYPQGVEGLLGGKIQRVEKTMLGENERYFIEIKKIKSSSKQYPRPDGTPRMKPLK